MVNFCFTSRRVAHSKELDQIQIQEKITNRTFVFASIPQVILHISILPKYIAQALTICWLLENQSNCVVRMLMFTRKCVQPVLHMHSTVTENGVK